MLKKAVTLLEKILLKYNSVLIKTMNELGRERLLNFSEQSWEYVRLSSLELIAHEIFSKNIVGCVAELGVYRGDFAKKINEVFHNRKLYLFDSFQGFSEQEVLKEMSNQYSSGEQDFSNTSVELVLSKMKYPEKCEVIQGFFPESVSNLEEEFVFVNIDTDLFDPTYNGLIYFYPRLVQGGYLFVHDYNNNQYKGVKAAVQKFCNEYEIGYFPLTDVYGTAIISK